MIMDFELQKSWALRMNPLCPACASFYRLFALRGLQVSCVTQRFIQG